MAKRKATPDVLAELLGSSAVELAEPRDRSSGGARAWEYRLVSFQDYKGWRPRYENGRELPDWTSGPVIHEYLESMGAQGWELAAASAGERMYGSGDHHQLYLKRRLNGRP